MRRGQAGWTLLETLAATTLVGLLVLCAGGLLSRVWVEAEAFGAREEAFGHRWLAVRFLRADVHRAASARVEEGALLLDGPAGTVRYRLEGSDLVRTGAGDRRFPLAVAEASFRVETLPRGRLVSYRLIGQGAEIAGQALVARDRRGSP